MPKVVVLSEQNRDHWHTRFRAGRAPLLDAVRRTDLRLGLVCVPENLSGLSIPDSVVHGTVPTQQYRDMLRRTKVMPVLAAVPRARRLVHGLTS